MMTTRHLCFWSVRMVWTTWLLAGMALGTAHAQGLCPVQPDPTCEGLKAPKAMVRIMTAGTPVSCGAEGSTGIGRKCTFNVKVVAETKDMPRCWAYLPYSDLKVTQAKKDRTITWNIDPSAPRDHYFAATDGIKLVPVKGSASSPSTTWIKDPSSGKKKFKLKVVDEAPSAFCHYPQVTAPDGKTLCCPADPVIANEP